MLLAHSWALLLWLLLHVQVCERATWHTCLCRTKSCKWLCSCVCVHMSVHLAFFMCVSTCCMTICLCILFILVCLCWCGTWSHLQLWFFDQTLHLRARESWSEDGRCQSWSPGWPMMGAVPGMFDVMLAALFHGALSWPGKALVPKSILGYEDSF